MGYSPQYWNQFPEAGNAAFVKIMVAAEHMLLSPLVLLVAVSDGASSNTAQPV